MVNSMIKEITSGDFDMIDDVRELRKSEYYPVLLNAWNTTRWDLLYPGMIYGTDHIERVMLLAAVLSMKQKISLAEAELVQIACAYHDIARDCSLPEPSHGERGADLLPELEILTEHLPEIQAAVAAHSMQDKTCLPGFMEKYGVRDRDLCRTIAGILDDANRLDLVRFFCTPIDDLNHEESIDVEAAAWPVMAKYYYPDLDDMFVLDWSYRLRKRRDNIVEGCWWVSCLW